MSNTQNFLTDNIEDIISIADNSLYVGSSTSVLDEIDIITNYESGSLGNDINNRFSAIDSNFKRIVQSDYLRGAPGANYGSKHIYFAKLDPNRVGANVSYNNPTLYNPVIKSGGSDPMIMDNTYILRALRDAILSKCLGNVNNLPSEPYSSDKQEVNDNFWNSQNELVSLKPIQAPNGDTINWHDNIASGIDDDYNVFTFIVEDQNGTLNAYSSLVYIFIDKRFEYITDANKDQYEGLVDLSCAIYFSYKRSGSAGTYSGAFESVQTFPTIEYNTDGNFYWKIYGSNSGLLAQGPKGDAASSAMIYCTYEPIENVTNYVKLNRVLVTYINDNNQETTSFMDVKEAVEKNYINLETVKNDNNHTKICAFCVRESDATSPVIMGTVCYTEDQNIIKGNDSNYIVRFESQLSFNHLFNQHNFFNIMLENYNDGSTTATENKFGALFIPMSKNSEGADVAAHTIYPANYSDTEGFQKTLNILPIKNIKNGAPKNIADMDGVILADCPMNVYYDVNLIKKSLIFDTSELIAVNSENNEIKIPHNFIGNKANFDISYNPYVIENSGNYVATPSLNVKYNWEYPNGINNLPTTVKPNIGLDGLALTLKFNSSGSSNIIKHSVLDLISDLAKNEYIDNWAGAAVDNEYPLRNILLNEDNDATKLLFRLIKTIGSICPTGDAAGNMYNYNLNTEYCNFTPLLFYSVKQSANDLSSISFNIGKTSTGAISIDDTPYKNIYFYGNTYPQRRRISGTGSSGGSYSASTYTDAIGISYRNYVDMYTYTYSNGANNGSIDIAQSNFATDSVNRLLKCPAYSLYRDYRSGKSLVANTETNSNKISYKKDYTKAYDSHPLDYNESDNANIASHEGGVVYPHKIMLTNNANDADNIANNSDLRNEVHQLNRTISGLFNDNPKEKYENYGTCIAYIHAPTTISDKPLNYQYFEGNNAVKIDLKFDKLIAPIINIRSNAYTSPGNDFMRGCKWHNSGLYLAAFNTLNTGLAINKATHSLSYRLVYKVKHGEGSQEVDVIKRTDNIQLTSTKAVQNIQTGVCGNMRRVFFDDAHNTNFAEKPNKIIRDNAPMMGQLCDPKLMTRAAFPIALEDYAKQQTIYGTGTNKYSTKYDSQSANISKPADYGLNIYRTPYMYGVQWLYNGGNISTDKTQLPYGTNYLLELHKRNDYAYKLYSMSKHCTPNDSLYNIGLYHMTYDNNGSKHLYTGNDGYRTVTLPYYPGNCSLIIDSKVFNNIPSTDRAQGATPNAELVGIEVMYNCEVVFDTLLDVISGSVFSDSYNWQYAADVWSDNYGSGLDIFISDAISHSKFIKHDLNSQINRLYAPTSKSGTVWDIRPNPQVAIDNGSTLKNEECYSGYRGTSYHISGDNAVHHPGSGYIYASTYDLDSYYNRAFINPYYYTSNSGNVTTSTALGSGSYSIPGDLIFNFRADKEIYSNNKVAYSDTPKGLDYKKMKLCYQHTGLSLKPIDGKRNISFRAGNTNKLFNHPPYFMGVGLINVENSENSDELLSQFGRGNNKGIVYLCHQNDTAYTTSNLDQHKIAYENKLLSRYDIITTDDLTGNNKTMNPYRGFNSLLMRNDADYSVNAQYMSPFVKTFGPGKSFSTRGYGTRITDQSLDKEVNGFDDGNAKRKMDSLNIIDYWYPKSTDIFNNPFMFTTPSELNTATSRDATLPNYSITDLTDPDDLDTDNLSNSFNLDKIKLAWRKFNIKNKSNGYYDGHTITYGELENVELSMLNIITNSGEYAEDICHTEFIYINNDDNTGSQVSMIMANDQSQDTDSSLVKNNNVNAHICNDGIIWNDTNNNYLAIRMSGDEIKYSDVNVPTPDGNLRQPIAGNDKLPETHLYISKNGSKSIYKVDFLALLLAAGTYLQKNITPGTEFITQTTLDDLIDADKEDGTDVS